MNYISTRGKAEKVTAAEAIIKGLATDGGLYIPESIPTVDLDFIKSLENLSYSERAKKVLALYLTDFTEDEISSCVTKAYGNNKFDTDKIVPLKHLSHMTIAELWHGPTSAFKDMALQLLPQLLSTALTKTAAKNDVLILVATSGDTGKAALEGFKNVERTKILVFYPNQGVSPMQELQMTTQDGDNVGVVAINGNFDDAQRGVKEIFADSSIKEQLAKLNIELSSANSINWGRLVPQIVYYFSIYADLVKEHKINYGDEIIAVVPTGNFGNILAGYYAKLMGLPIKRLVCASNSNDVLTEFLQTGRYNAKREFYKTISPSMDILVSSNLERLLYHITKDPAKVAEYMAKLQTDGEYTIEDSYLKEIQKLSSAHSATDSETKTMIFKANSCQKYLADPHTAVAVDAARSLFHEQKITDPTVVLSTASPYKFNKSVLEAINQSTEGDEFTLLDRLQANYSEPIPKGLASLKTAAIRHQEVIEKTAMGEKTVTFAS